jgi:hypothetical protein
MFRLPRDLIKEIISYYPCPQWYRLCKELYTLASQVISPVDYVFIMGSLSVGPLEYVVDKGNVEAVAFLLKDPRVNPAANANLSIRAASKLGHKDIVEMLLKDPRVNPTVCYDNALWWAVYSGHKYIVELILRDPRIKSLPIAQLDVLLANLWKL